MITASAATATSAAAVAATIVAPHKASITTGEASRIVTLPNGETVTLGKSGSRYVVTSGADDLTPINAIGTGNPASGARAIYAIPLSAEGLLADGALDRGLFDVAWLAGHNDTSAISIVLRYAGHPAASWLAEHGARLPGASVAATSPSAGTVTVRVAAGEAPAFWAALTGQNAPWRPGQVPSEHPHLRDGIASAWLAGHRTPAAVRPAGQTLFTVTETITRKEGLYAQPAHLYGVSGGGVGALTYAKTQVCQDPLCTVITATFQVPAGTYAADTMASVRIDALHDQVRWVDLSDPQFTVAGDTKITVDADKALPVTVSTPRPSMAFTGEITNYRTSADGTYLFDSLLNFQLGDFNFLAIPDARPVSVGTLRFTTDFTLGPAPVTMTTQGSGGFSLHPLYAGYARLNETGWPPFVRFSGNHVLRLISAGNGSKQAFSKINAHGKLVLLSQHGCVVYPWQFNNAIAAGAVGMVMDPRDSTQSNGTCSSMPLYPNPRTYSPLPNVTVPGAIAAKLDSLLAKGSVQVAVDDSGPSRYTYHLSLDTEGRIPGSLHYTVAGSQLAQVNTDFDSAKSQPVYLATLAFRPGVAFLMAQTYNFTVPHAETEYFGPVSPGIEWERQLQTPEQNGVAQAWDSFRAGTQGDTWLAEPAAPGAAEPTASPAGSLMTVQEVCSLCRQGNFLYPAFMGVAGAQPSFEQEIFSTVTAGLYRTNGTQIPLTLVHNYYGFVLPAQRQAYRLVTSYGTTSTTWHFTSGKPAADTVPAAEPCIGTIQKFSADHCAADPLIFLRYNAHTNISDAVTAPGARTMQITPYYQAVKAPARITSLRLWTSTDGGKTWQAATVTKNADGSYTATYQLPKAGSATGTVSLKAQAGDSAGDTVSETILDAYNVAAAA